MWAAEAGGVEMTCEKLEQTRMRGKEILGMLLLLVQCILITGGILFPDKEGVGVPKNVSFVSCYIGSHFLLELIIENTFLHVDRILPLLCNFHDDSRFHPWVFVDHSLPQRYSKLN